MIMAASFRAINVMRIIGRGLLEVRSSLLLAMFCFLCGPVDARAQLWETPPLPAVKYAPTPDGLTVSVGSEQIHVSVCRSAVIHFVANPDASKEIRSNQPWMLDQKDSCPGAKHEISKTADAVILTTDALKIEFSLKWGNIQYSTLAGESLLRERNSLPRTYEPVELNGEKTFHVEDREWPIQLPRCERPARPEQHGCGYPFAPVEQRLRLDVEHCFLYRS